MRLVVKQQRHQQQHVLQQQHIEIGVIILSGCRLCVAFTCCCHCTVQQLLHLRFATLVSISVVAVPVLCHHCAAPVLPAYSLSEHPMMGLTQVLHSPDVCGRDTL